MPSRYLTRSGPEAYGLSWWRKESWCQPHLRNRTALSQCVGRSSGELALSAAFDSICRLPISVRFAAPRLVSSPEKVPYPVLRSADPTLGACGYSPILQPISQGLGRTDDPRTFPALRS